MFIWKYSKSYKLNTNYNNVARHYVRATNVTISNGYGTVTHNLGTQVYPVVVSATSGGHAIMCYGIGSASTTAFSVGLMYADGYKLSQIPNGTTVTVYWTF